jgi:hypothetical protein
MADADHAGLSGAAEVLGDDLQAAARGCVRIARIERQDDGGLRTREHVDGEVFGDGPLDEWNELLGQPAQDDARIGGRIDGGKLRDERRDGNAGRPHGLGEQRPLARHMPQNRRRSDLQLRCDIGEGGGLEALGCKDPPRRIEELLAPDDRWPSHL